MNHLLKALVSCVFGLMAVCNTSAIPTSSPGVTSGITTSSTQNPYVIGNPGPAGDTAPSSVDAAANPTSLPVNAVNITSGDRGTPSQTEPLPIGLANANDSGATTVTASPALSTNTTTNSTASLPVDSSNSTPLNGTVASPLTPPASGPVSQTSLASTVASATPALANDSLAVQAGSPSPDPANGTFANPVTPPAAGSVSNSSSTDAVVAGPLPGGNSTNLPLNLTTQVKNPTSGPSSNNDVGVTNLTSADQAQPSGGVPSN